MQPSDELRRAVEELTRASGYQFEVSEVPVPGTTMFVVHTNNHEFRPEYTSQSGVLGFRVPFNFPAAAPEDCFFVRPAEIKLVAPDTVRNSIEVNRAGVATNFTTGSSLGDGPVLLFSWHLWNQVPWNRRTHTLLDHYAHCVRRFTVPEHD